MNRFRATDSNLHLPSASHSNVTGSTADSPNPQKNGPANPVTGFVNFTLKILKVNENFLKEGGS
jgi:hypothetical protein